MFVWTQGNEHCDDMLPRKSGNIRKLGATTKSKTMVSPRRLLRTFESDSIRRSIIITAGCFCCCCCGCAKSGLVRNYIVVSVEIIKSETARVHPDRFVMPQYCRRCSSNHISRRSNDGIAMLLVLLLLVERRVRDRPCWSGWLDDGHAGIIGLDRWLGKELDR